MSDQQELLNQINTEIERASTLYTHSRLEELRSQSMVLEEQMATPGFWDNTHEANKISQQFSRLQHAFTLLDEVRMQLDELKAFQDLISEEEENPELELEARRTIKQLRAKLDQLELERFFSGKYDSSPALLLIRAGQGGTEAMDWASMVQRMYLRFFERKGWKFELLDESRGDEAGIKSCSIAVHGEYAYGLLKHETGTHRLVRLSPFNADSLRQTSFVGVEVSPYIEDDAPDLELNPDELEWAFTRAGGHGGQNVNKVNTAVRLRHIPTNEIVEVRQERSQEQNRTIALAILKSRLVEKQERDQQAEIQKEKPQSTTASWGTQIRNYVLHPYQLVKDTRTNHETSDTAGVLDGDLEGFIQAELRWYTESEQA